MLDAACGECIFERDAVGVGAGAVGAMVCVPAKAEEPKRLRPKRAPSSSAQSTRRMVTGGLPLYSCGDAAHEA
jgi:hypothetical protein